MFSLLHVITMICAFSNTFENLAKCMDFDLFSGVVGGGRPGKRQSVLSTVTPCELSVTCKSMSIHGPQGLH